MKWTSEQQEAIELREKNILVSAAAGSGKTAVLVERIKQLIIGDQIPLDHMLIVTFSNAAASEMREKIVAAITKEIEGAEGEDLNSSKIRFLRNQLNQIHKANISTFHAFSMEVIRRYFYLIDIEPNFKICDEAQKIILQADSMEELFSTSFEARDQGFLSILNKYGLTKNDDAVKSMIYETHNFIQSIPDSFGWLHDQVEAQNCSKEDFYKGPVFLEVKGEIERSLHLVKNSFLKARELLDAQGISSLIIKCDKDINSIEEIINVMESESFEQVSTLICAFKAQVFTASKEDKESYEEIKETITAYRQRGKDIIKKLKDTYLAKPMEEFVQELQDTYGDALALKTLVEVFDRIYKDKKQKKGLIDFNDIEHYALDILSHEEAAKEYQNKFGAIFVDEYQDSNIVQETLINRIKRDNNVFMVGDVKQSIYKFRLAEPEIFISKYESFKENKSSLDQKIDLNRNFRSKGQVIAAVNDIFSQIMKKDISGLEYDEAAALYQGDAYAGELDYPVELHLADDMQLADGDIDEEIKEMKKAEIEAFTAAQIIKEAKGSLIYDSKKQMTRSLTNKDVVILLRGARGTAEIYYEALMREGIPAFVDNSDGYFDTLEVEIFLNLLRVIDNKKQDIPLLSMLRSSIFGYTVEELIEIRLRNRREAYYKAFEDYAEEGEQPELREKCRTTLDKLSTWKRQATFIPLEDFLWKLIYDTGYNEYIGAIPGGIQRQANLRALVDKAVQFQSSQMKGLFQFINYIEAIKKRKVSMGQVKLLGENDDVVRIMTIHKSKGLEFPMVLVGGLGKRFNKDRATYRVSLHKDIGLGMRYVDRENSSYKKTITQMVIEGRKDREGLAEELRILYVAFTRAMDKLVLLGTVTNIDEALRKYELTDNTDLSSGSCYLDFLVPSLGGTDIGFFRHDRGEISISKEETDSQKEEVRKLISEYEMKDAEDEELRAEIHRRLSFEYPHKDALSVKSKFTVSELNRILSGEAGQRRVSASLAVPKFCGTCKGFTAAEKGTILHKVMEHIDFRKMGAYFTEDLSKKEPMEKKAIQYVRDFANQMVQRLILTEEEAETVVVQKIIGFFQTDIGRRASKADRLYKEVSFNSIKEILGEKIIVQGTIDCYFEEDGRVILLDYKSSYIAGGGDGQRLEELADSYRPQIMLYKEALEAIRDIKVEEAYLYLFHIGEFYKVS